jgi:hypothetical protein
MKNVGESDTQCVLQDLIRDSALPEKCKNAQKPRRMFAAKMFLTALSEFFYVYVLQLFLF